VEAAITVAWSSMTGPRAADSGILPAHLAGTGELRVNDPRRIGSYQVLRRLGSGGMGRVYLARSPGGRAVAIKVIRPDLAQRRGFRARFAREVAAARGVSGIFTAAVVDADPEAELPWMATAYVEGPSLADAVEEHGPLPPRAVLSLAAGLAEGLQAIHRAGLVHRDLKPSNVLLANDGPRVIDFGVSWAGERDRLTDDGMTVGSPGFLSPEQARGREVDEASDVFSLGAVLTYAATGEGPFGDGPDEALMYRVVHEPADLAGVPDELRWLIESCLAKKAGYRPTVQQLLDRLTASAPADSIAASPATHDSAAWLHAVAGSATGASMAELPAAGPDESGALGNGAPAVPRTGDRLSARYRAVRDTPPGAAYPGAEMPAPPLEPLERDQEPGARRWWLPLVAVAACVALAGGAVMALTSSSDSPVPPPASPPALVVPTAAGASPGTSAAARPSHTAPSRSATGPAGTTAPAKAGASSSSAPPATSPTRPSSPPTSPPVSTQPTSTGPTSTTAPPAPSPSASHCILFICS
jgi:eukaryotic-like serine/threonine-protein kinase